MVIIVVIVMVMVTVMIAVMFTTTWGNLSLRRPTLNWFKLTSISHDNMTIFTPISEVQKLEIFSKMIQS